VRVDRWLPDDPYPVALVADIPDDVSADDGTTLAGAEFAVRRLRSLLSELGDVPALPHNLRITGDEEDVGWQLCDMAPLTALDLQRLLATEGLMTRMQLLTELCDAMAEDVTRMLADGSSE
jgi:hypothetical protein